MKHGAPNVNRWRAPWASVHSLGWRSGHEARFQDGQAAFGNCPCGSMTNFLGTPASNSA